MLSRSVLSRSVSLVLRHIQAWRNPGEMFEQVSSFRKPLSTAETRFRECAGFSNGKKKNSVRTKRH